METHTVDKILIAIPAYNEAATITEVINDVHTVMPHATIVVIDDGSADNTGFETSRIKIG